MDTKLESLASTNTIFKLFVWIVFLLSAVLLIQTYEMSQANFEYINLEQKATLAAAPETTKTETTQTEPSTTKKPQISTQKYWNPKLKKKMQAILKDIEESETTTEATTTEATTTLPNIYTNQPIASETCSSEGRNLVGALAVDLHAGDEITKNWDQISKDLSKDMQSGGYFKPKNCTSLQTLAILIPFRDRELHLKIFLHHMIPIFKRQLLEFVIYVVELVDEKEKFPRGSLFNAGFEVALQQHNISCFIFHDVDLLMENDRNMYHCDPENPKHMSVAVDQMRYKLPYPELMGGIIAVPKQTFRELNGYSNQFWGWGGEDDDFARRVTYSRFKKKRPPASIARYKMLKHKKAGLKKELEVDRFTILRSAKRRMGKDGLNSLKYKLVRTEKHALYTKIFVDMHRSDYKNGRFG